MITHETVIPRAPAAIPVFLLVCIMVCGAASAASTALNPAVEVNPAVLAVATTTTAAPLCPAPCECMAQSAAADKWGANGYQQCSQTPCSRAVLGNSVVPYYCYHQSATTTTSACPSPCECMAQSAAADKWGANGYQQCSQTPCGRAPTATAVIPYYCYSQAATTAVTTTPPATAVPVAVRTVVPVSLQPVTVPVSLKATYMPHVPITQIHVCIDPCTMNGDSTASFSWTTWCGNDWMTSVKDQGACGSCYAESPTGTLEAKYNIEQGSQQNLDTAEEVFVSPCFTPDPGSCLGGSRGEVLNDLRNHGVPDESVMPYQSGACAHDDGTGHLACNAGIGAHCSVPNSCNLGVLAPDHVWKVSAFGSSSGSVGHVKQELLCKGPLSVCSGNWWHCVVLVGWDNSVNGGSWLIKNSWGTGWGSGGYGWIAFNGDSRSEIRNDAQYVSGIYKVGGM